MMTNDIGKFIQEIRKEKGLTQKELAEIVGVSDKTISKWENGNSSPDTSMLLSLSEALEVTVNELLSAERIPPENYSMKAEETIMTLMKENEAGKRTHLISQVIGLLLIILAFVLIFIVSAGTGAISFFLDAASFIFLLIVSVGVVLVSGARDRDSVLKLLSKTVIPIGLVITIVEFIIFMTLICDLSKVGPNLCVMMLSILYSCIAKVIIEILIAKGE